jgi:CheY-like chemotaxis protein
MSEMIRATSILFVDPDPTWLSPLQAEAGSDAPDPLSLHACRTVEAALAELADGAHDAVVMSLDMGDDPASTLVGEIEHRFPGLPLVAHTARLDDAKIAAACHFGAAAVLVRPFTLLQLTRVLRLPAPDAGFSGTTTGVPTAALLTLHSTAGDDGVLHLRCESTKGRQERSGSIYLDAGQPVHATAGDLVGSEAVHAMLGWVDAEATWLPGFARCARTIVGRWEGLLTRTLPNRHLDDAAAIDAMVGVAYPDVVEKLSRLAQTPDVLGAFLLRHAEVITGRCTPDVDEPLASRALCRLAHVFFDVDAQPHEDAGREIQAIVGTMRLVLDRVGPPEAGFQVGVLVRQAAPVCKSLRRLLRQVDLAFERAVEHDRRRGSGRHDPLSVQLAS